MCCLSWLPATSITASAYTIWKVKILTHWPCSSLRGAGRQSAPVRTRFYHCVVKDKPSSRWPSIGTYHVLLGSHPASWSFDVCKDPPVCDSLFVCSGLILVSLAHQALAAPSSFSILSSFLPITAENHNSGIVAYTCDFNPPKPATRADAPSTAFLKLS